MKIAYFINHYPKVSHSFIRREILALQRQGLEIQRIALRGWDDPLPDEEDRKEQALTRYVLRAGIGALLLPTLAALLRSPVRFTAAVRLALSLARNSKRPLGYHLIYVAEASRILPWVKAFGARGIHAHFGTNSTEIVLLLHVLGGPPYSFTVHGPEEFEIPLGLDEKIHRSTFVAAISHFCRSQLLMRAQYRDWPKIKIIHCGLEPSFFAPPQPTFVDAPRLVCVGRLCEAKGQLLLIDAAAKLAATVAFELVLVGDGPMRPQLEQLIHKYRLSDRVRITGWVGGDEVRNEILAARALVLPSFAEGLPVVIMEAMALRRPVLTTYVAGIPELVLPGETGWLFPAGSVEELATAMRQCLSTTPSELQRLGNAARNRVIARHCVDTEAAKLAELFRTYQAESRQEAS